MNTNWITNFDAALKKHYGIDHFDAGLGVTELRRYSDLDPVKAAHQFAQDYDLDRIDGPWGVG